MEQDGSPIEPDQTGETGKQNQTTMSTEQLSDTIAIGGSSDQGKENHSSVRVKARNKQSGLTDVIELTSQSHQVYQGEIATANYQRLQEICDELNQMHKNINAQYDEVNRALSKPNSLLVHDIDTLNADNQKLRNFAEERMSRLSVRPKTSKRGPRQSPTASTTSRVSASARQLVVLDDREDLLSTVSSKTSKSSEISISSSTLRLKAKEAQAEEEAKKAKLAALQEQELQEAELEAVQLQQQQELQRRKREIERTKLQGDIAADQRRREVLEQAAAEEEIPILLRPPT